MKFEIGKLYYIEWEDHWGASYWKEQSKITIEDDTVICRTIGWCVKDTPKVVVLSSSQDELNHSDTVMSGHTMGRIKSCIINAYEIVGV